MQPAKAVPHAANENVDWLRHANDYGAGASTTYGYDGMSRLYSLVHNASGTANDVSFGYSYNPASEIAGRTVSNAAFKWGVAADFSDAYTDNSLNQIATLDGAPFAHDARGNTTDDATKTYTYDADDRMTGAGTAAYAFDPSGRLYQETTGATTRLLYAGDQLIAEYDGTNALIRRFVPGGLDEPLVWLEGTGTGNRKWLLADERGSIIAHANATAAVSQINKYDPYGIAGAGVSGRFRYAGSPSLAGAGGLYNNRARAYSPAAGRFMQADPIGYSGGMNLYAYVGNDPVNATDPWGLRGWTTCTTVGTKTTCTSGDTGSSNYGWWWALPSPSTFDSGNAGVGGGAQAVADALRRGRDDACAQQQSYADSEQYVEANELVGVIQQALERTSFMQFFVPEFGNGVDRDGARYTATSSGWVDLQHVIFSGFSWEGVKGGGAARGAGLEIAQGLFGFASARFSQSAHLRSDYYSNALGQAAANQFYWGGFEGSLAETMAAQIIAQGVLSQQEAAARANACGN